MQFKKKHYHSFLSDINENNLQFLTLLTLLTSKIKATEQFQHILIEFE